MTKKKYQQLCRNIPEYNSINKYETTAANKVMKSGLLSGFLAMPNKDSFFGGPEVLNLEKKWKKRFESDFAISVNSASSGLVAALLAMNVKPGDEVIVPPYTMSATAMAPISIGAVPIFVDIEDRRFGLDPSLVKKFITPKTKAIIVVNLFGNAAYLKELRKIADKNNIYLIEDNAQSILATYNNKLCGKYGHVGIFSLNRHKHIHCGEGGICITDNEEIGKNILLIRNHGENASSIFGEKDNRICVGYNFRMTEISAAIASVQLDKLDNLVERTEKIGLSLNEYCEDFEYLDMPLIEKNCRHVFFMWAPKLQQKKLGVPRDVIYKDLVKERVPISQGYVKPLYHLPIFDNSPACKKIKKRELCNITEGLYNDELLTIQIPGLDIRHKDIKSIYMSFKKTFSKYKKFI